MKLFHIGVPILSLSLLWLILSGVFDPFHIALGILSIAIVVRVAWNLLLFPKDKLGGNIWDAPAMRIQWKHACSYPFIFLLNVIKANLQVAVLILDPKMPIDPVLLRFSTPYKTDAAKILLGNSITLTPGTVTLDIRESDFLVHALSPALADSLMDGTDMNRVARVFGEVETETLEVLMTRNSEELVR